ncbi:MAG: ATP-binding protein [Bacteroidales bacterium]|nr:ATP-binding protein [Bacteroidales bacterium]
MKLSGTIKGWVAGVLLLLGALSLSLALAAPRAPGDTGVAARRAGQIISLRLAKLDKYTEKALAQSEGDWLNLGKIPSDMVIYRYFSDTLQSWANAFPQINDDISERPAFWNIITLRGSPKSPLAEVGEVWTYINLGPKWYLARSRSDGASVRVISALEIVNTLDTRRLNGINSRLLVGEKYSVHQLSDDGGSEVSAGGIPQFKIMYESLSGKSSADPLLVWLAFFLMVASGFLYILDKRTLNRFYVVAAFLTAAMVAIFFWGKAAQWDVGLFSPAIYAGGRFLYSLGVVVTINIVVFLLSLFIYLVRDDIYQRLGTTRGIWVAAMLAIAASLGILAYVHIALKSIVLNSGITLELYKFGELDAYTILVYLSFLTLLLSIPLLMKLSYPALARIVGKDFDVLSRRNRVVYSLVVSLYLVLLTSLAGFQKEQRRVEMWANRIAFDRDISLEMSLGIIEQQIANDATISMFSAFENTESVIQSRLQNIYFSRVDNGYEVGVFLLNSFNATQKNIDYLDSFVSGGIPVSDGSRFMYVNSAGGKSSYAGIFTYNVAGHGMTNLLVTLTNENDFNAKGYAYIFGIAPPGRIVLPADYSFARYDGRKLRLYKGDYAYPTTMDDDLYDMVYSEGRKSYNVYGYTHFLCNVNGEETVIISRKSYSIINYAVSFILVALLFFLMLTLLTFPRQKPEVFEKGYYRNRISAVLLVSLSTALVAMALASVLFVASRNESNLRSVMSDKVSSISTMLENGSVPLHSVRDLLTPAFHEDLQKVADNTNSDITIFGPSGRIIFSTNPLVYDRFNLGSRMDGMAYEQIVRDSRRYSLIREDIDGHKFYSMYAPIKGEDGNIVGILCSPYTEESYDFEKDAVTHLMTIIAVFMLLLMLALFAVSKVIDRMFNPLVEMSRKMENTSLDSLERIEYRRDDEISSLVSAYNMMVNEIADNSRKLAQAERDKAWSGMARQVAHEIKNPLTPMKLQIQRIIRLKEKGDPGWQDKFDEVTGVLLDHIDILTDTANEFSTFAKLYSEDPTEINLDKILQEEISMFDNKGNVKFEYAGLENAVVQGPKPQLTRVFVNLINNAEQAVEGKDDARIFIALRKSVEDGYYDITFEDNGPGVSEENVGKLFTPNFTTKSSGSGLGLAISRSILERCGATISYSRSFLLGGACFTIKYPVQS